MKNGVPIYAIDFEGSKGAGVVEFGAVGIFEGEIFFSETSICAPRAKIDFRSEKLTGISNAEASKHPPFESFAETFISMRQNGLFAAHNFSAEDSMLRSHIPSPGRVKNFLDSSETLSWAPWLDSIAFAKFLDGALQSLKLSSAASALGITAELDARAAALCPAGRAKWHCALYDALACALIIKKALEKIEDFGELKKIAAGDAQQYFGIA
ncbi:MAG: hypothetical protein J6P03_09045 [Opitutales bacterium]|nr:hypothetical protein [Opitutales bacterium]